MRQEDWNNDAHPTCPRCGCLLSLAERAARTCLDCNHGDGVDDEDADDFPYDDDDEDDAGDLA
jgi:hypothetical protein